MSARRRFDPTVNYYAILDVPVDASQRDITRTYRQLMRRIHPDRVADPQARRAAEERAKDVNAAYAVLSKPALRRAYDRDARLTLMSGAVRHGYSGPTTRPRRQPTYTQWQATARRYPRPEDVETRRATFAGAIRQLFVTFIAAAIVLILLIVLGNLALSGLELLLS